MLRADASAATAGATGPDDRRPTSTRDRDASGAASRRQRSRRRRGRRLADGRVDRGDGRDRVPGRRAAVAGRVDVRPVRHREHVAAVVVDRRPRPVGRGPRGGRGSRPRPSTGAQSIVTWPRPPLGPHVARAAAARRRAPAGRARSGRRASRTRRSAGWPGAAALRVTARGRSQRRSPGRRRTLHADERLERVPDLLRRERVAQQVVRRARCRSRP